MNWTRTQRPTGGRVLRICLLLAALVAASLLAGMEPARAAFPGTNGKISFSSNNDVLTMDADPATSDRINRSNNGTVVADGLSAVSPDGSRIVFRSNRDGKDEIYLMNADGSNQTRLTNAVTPVQSNDSPAFSPDGTRIVFHRTVAGSPSPNTDVFVMDAAPESPTNQPVRLTDAAARDEDAVFSPNGQKIAFSSARDGNDEIYIMNRDGSNETRLTSTAGIDRFPNFSPSGGRIAFASGRDGNTEVYMMDTDPATNDAIRLTDNLAFDSQPAFSPDGTQIAFESGRSGANIHLMDTDPNTLDTEANVPSLGSGSQPDWGPADTTPPDTAITGGASGPFDGTSTNFTFTSTEGGTFQCKLDNAAFANCTSPHLVSSLGEEPHTFQVKAIDASGNEDTTPAIRAFTVDTIDPNTNIIAGPSGPTNDDSPSFTFTSGETNSTFKCRLDTESFAACPSPKNFTDLPDGAYAFEVKAVDAAGNEDATPAIRAFTVDTTPPETSIDTGPPSATNETSANLTFSSESGATFQCSLDDATFADCTSSQNLTGLGEGNHTFQVKASDSLGNEDATPAEHEWIVDLTPPDTSIIAGPSGSVKSGAASFVFTSESGSTFECSLDGSPFGGCASPQNFNVAGGNHTFRIKATDAAGNIETAPAERAWTVDATPPAITPVSPRPNSSSFKRTQKIQATVADGLADLAAGDIKLFVDGKAKTFAYNQGSNALVSTASNLSFKKHTVKIIAIDAAGNATTRQWSFTVKKKKR